MQIYLHIYLFSIFIIINTNNTVHTSRLKMSQMQFKQPQNQIKLCISEEKVKEL